MMKESRKKQLMAITGVVAVLVLVIVILSCVTPITPTAELELKLPPEWQKVKDLKPKGGGFGALYSGTGTEEDALATFKPIMEDVGWTYVTDYVRKVGAENFTSLVFSKGEQKAVVFADGPAHSIAVYVLVLTPQPTEQLEVREVPQQDCEGADIPDVPRYPGSVRTHYEGSPNGILVTYITSKDAKTVADFYAGQLRAGGWAFQSMTVGGERAEISAANIKKRQMITITIGGAERIAGYTDVNLALMQL